MTHLTIDHKNKCAYLKKTTRNCKKIAALTRVPEKIFSIEEARIFSKRLVKDGLPKSNYQALYVTGNRSPGIIVRS